MIWEPRPLPEVTPETAAFWADATEGTFRLTECADCGLVFYYPRAHCPDCFSEDVSGKPAEGYGEVYTYAVTNTVGGWPNSTLPNVSAIVELEEGPRVMTTIVDCDPEEVETGSKVEVDFVKTGLEDVAIPVFRLSDPHSGKA